MPGWQSLIVCDGVATTALPRCDFNAFIQLIKNGVTDLVILATFFAVVVLMWAGFLWLTDRGSEQGHKRAIQMLGKVIWGYVWIIAAWVIVYTITSTLLNPEFNQILQGSPPQT